MNASAPRATTSRHVAGQGLIEIENFIRSIKASVVIDHMGRPDITEGLDGATMTVLRRLLDTGRVWAKVSGVDRLSKIGAPYRDAVPFAQSLVAHAPDRVLWGTDWPHVNLHGPIPDDADLVDLIAEIFLTDAARHRLLVENPAHFFGFRAFSA